MSDVDYETISDEIKLQKMLTDTQDFDERQKIRQRIRDIRDKQEQELEAHRKNKDSQDVQRRQKLAEEDKQRRLDQYNKIAQDPNSVRNDDPRRNVDTVSDMAMANEASKQRTAENVRDMAGPSLSTHSSQSERLMQLHQKDAEEAKQRKIQSTSEMAKRETHSKTETLETEGGLTNTVTTTTTEESPESDFELFFADMAEFAMEAALLQGYAPHKNDDLEVAIPCRCYGRGLTMADFTNLRWPAAMIAAAAGHSKAIKTVERRPGETCKKELSPIHKERKLCSRGRGQLMSRSAAEYDMIQSQRSSRSSGRASVRDLIEDCPSVSPRMSNCPSVSLRKSNEYICHKCNLPGHDIRVCPSGSLPKGYICHACNVPGHHVKDCPSGGLPKDYVCHACNVPGHHVRDCPTKTGKLEKDGRSEKSDWRAQSPNRGESPRKSAPSRESSQPPFRGNSTPSSPIQPSTFGLDFFRPEWLEQQNEKKHLQNQKQAFNINVGVSKTNNSGFSTTDDDADLFMQFRGFKPVLKKEFNLKAEEFPDLGAATPSEPKKERISTEKKTKTKKVKMVSYNSKENSPIKQACGVKPQPTTYSHAVQTPKDCQVMVQGLPVDCVESEVLNLVEPFGQVVYVNIQKDQSGYASAIVGLVSPEKVEWVIDCLSGAESLFHVWLMHPASVDPITNASRRILLSVGAAVIVQFADPHSLLWIMRHSPYLDFQLRSQVHKNPNANDVVLTLPTQTFNKEYLSVLTGEWIKSKDSVSWSHLDFERLLKAAAFLQIGADDLKPRFPGSVDIHNVSRFSAAFWCYNSAPPHLSYKDFIPLFLYDMNYDMSMFETGITRKNFLLKMRSNFRSNIRFSTAWNPKWLDDKTKDKCPLTHTHEHDECNTNTHLTGAEIEDLLARFICIDEWNWKDHKKEFLESSLHRLTCMRFPKGFGPILLEHACQYYEAKTTLKTEKMNEKS